MTNTSHESYLTPFITAMNIEFKDQWCVLHSYESLPYFSKSDVDMAFSGNDISKLEALITTVAKKSNWQLYQKLWYDVKKCFYYVLKKNNEDVFLAIDFLIDNDGIGKYGFKTSLLTQNCNWYQEVIPIPNHEIACCYKLIKRIVKKRPLEEDAKYIRDHFRQSDPEVIKHILAQHFNSKDLIVLRDFLEKKNNNLTQTKINQLHNSRKKFIASVSSGLKHTIWETLRILERIITPSGLVIYIPNLEKEKQEKFTKHLSEKLGILFRFVNLEHSNSFLSKFKSLVGSTLLICPKNNYNPKKSIQRNWLFKNTTEVKIQPEMLQEQSNDELVNAYYLAILSKLNKRFS